MPKPNAPTIDDIQAPATVLVEGELVYSRLASKIEGEELAEVVNRDRALNANVIHDPNKPYTTVSLCNAQVITQPGGQASVADRYVAERLFYQAKDQATYPGNSLRIEDKGNDLPAVAVLGSDGNYYQIILERDLAPRQTVKMLIRFFPTRAMHNGRGIACVLLDHEPEILGNRGSNLVAEAAAYGITLIPTKQTTAMTMTDNVIENPILHDYDTTSYEQPVQPAQNAYADTPYTPAAQPAPRPGIRYA